MAVSEENAGNVPDIIIFTIESGVMNPDITGVGLCNPVSSKLASSKTF